MVSYIRQTCGCQLGYAARAGQFESCCLQNCLHFFKNRLTHSHASIAKKNVYWQNLEFFEKWALFSLTKSVSAPKTIKSFLQIIFRKFKSKLSIFKIKIGRKKIKLGNLLTNLTSDVNNWIGFQSLSINFISSILVPSVSWKTTLLWK